MNDFNSSWTILEAITGSYLYGTATFDSDVDKRGVCIPPKQVLLDPFSNFEQQELEGDHIIYSLKKFIQLASDCNPNIIELFFINNENISKITDKGITLLANSRFFISQKARYTFAGYAQSQLKRIKLHRKWLLDPPKRRPTRADFGLKAMPNECISPIRFDILQYINSDTLRQIIKPEYEEQIKAEVAYASANEHYNNYLTWKQTRNPARAELETKFGYDTKHAMHLYRLLGECEELLTMGRITFPRPDWEFLMEIRNGRYSYETIIDLGESFKQRIDSIPSSLPEKPDINKLREFYFDMIEEL